MVRAEKGDFPSKLVYFQFQLKQLVESSMEMQK